MHLEKVMDLAEYAVEMSKAVWSCELDYSLDSLEKVNYIIDEIRGYENVAKNRINFSLVTLGCYVGEVMTRTSNGTWSDETNTHGLPVNLKIGNMKTDPIYQVFRRYREGKDHDIHHYASCIFLFSSVFDE